MKKIIKIMLCCILFFVVATLSVTGAFAEIIYQYYGLSYTIINNDSVSICGWDDSANEVVIPESINNRAVISIDNRAFINDEAISKISFEEAKELYWIGMFSFKGCTGLTNISIPSQITYIGTAAFEDCSSLEAVEYEASVNSVPNQCFNRCSALSSAVLTDNIETIGNFAFANCPKLERIDIPASVISISPVAFSDDPNLTLGVWYGSYAHQYAIDNNINYTLLDGVKLGDVDGDGDITITDATAIQRYLAELETLDAIHLYAADANEDKEVDIADATAIQMAVAKISTGHPIGEVITK